VSDSDLIGLAMREVQRLSAEPVGPNPFTSEPPIDAARDVKPDATVNAPNALPLAELDLDTAIRLRRAPRDIEGKRTKFMPLTPGDLQALIGIGLVEMRDEIPTLTSEGYRDRLSSLLGFCAPPERETQHRSPLVTGLDAVQREQKRRLPSLTGGFRAIVLRDPA
jgi:hypothetical protein